ncbi:MAG: 50S ribosomal protein L21 [Bacteroidetes bacterium]|nr:50S ribosomal protein L21 [Bacteroidota bacterium]
MYAIVDIAGQQFKVEEKSKVLVHRLEGKEGDVVDAKDVFLIDNNGKVAIGNPILKDARVTLKILQHLKGDKTIVFKKKRRKGYQVKNGHRQYLSEVEIQKIEEKAKGKSAKKDTEVAKDKKETKTPKAEKATKEAEVAPAEKKKKKAPAAKKKTAATKAKKPATKKPVAKKKDDK